MIIGKLRRAYRRLEAPTWLFTILAGAKPKFHCPICGYRGPFRDISGRWNTKKNTKCPNCGSTERTRLLWLAIDAELPQGGADASQRIIHFAPEDNLRHLVRQKAGRYETSSFDGGDADHAADLRDLPFDDASYDVVIASHVLEHIKEDRAAIAEIHRVLAPGGKAFLPVPMTAGDTEEYDAPRPEEADHVRGPGLDYFDRYREVFDEVTVHSAEDYSTDHHLLVDMPGALGYHYIPVCKKQTAQA
ncbi:MAG: methyltransferase domain-containing protein [Pseudomonadota bacterium]